MAEIILRIAVILLIAIVGLSLFFIFLPLLIVFAIVAIVLKTLFGVNMVRYNKVNLNFGRRPGRPPHPRPDPAPNAETAVPASEAVIDAEAVEIEDDPKKLNTDQ